MPNRMIRREPSSYWSDTKHIFLIAALIIAFMFSITPIQREVVRLFFINLKSVIVADHVVGENPEVVATRTIHNDFVGRFSVTIRRASDDGVACLMSWPDWFPYKVQKQGTPNELHYPSDFRDWVGDANKLNQCIAAGRYGPGLYYLQTCHFVKVMGPFHLHRCVDGAVYERKAIQ